MTHSAGILVISESQNGEPDPVAASLVGEARAWGESFGPALGVSALVFDPGDRAGDMLGPYGAERVYQCQIQGTGYEPEVKARTAAALAREIGANWIFGLHGYSGAALAPRLACLLGAGLVSRCLAVEKRADGGFTAMQPVHEGRLIRQLILSETRPNILSWDPNALGRREPEGETAAETVRLEPVVPENPGQVRPLRRIKGDPRTLPLEQADRIVALGRGMVPEGLPAIEALAERLEAAIGATRPVIDVNMLPFERQIGQTGVTVSPRLLVTCGISGANEFTVGIRDSQIVVAINKDPQARIFTLADLGLIGNGHEILAEFLKVLERERASGKGTGGDGGS